MLFSAMSLLDFHAAVCFIKVYYVQDINAGLKDVTKIPEEQVSPCFHSMTCFSLIVLFL